MHKHTNTHTQTGSNRSLVYQPHSVERVYMERGLAWNAAMRHNAAVNPKGPRLPESALDNV